MSDTDIRLAFEEEFVGLDPVERCQRAVQLNELITRELSVFVADERALAVLELKDSGLSAQEIKDKTGIVVGTVEKLVTRANALRANREVAGS